MLLNKHKDEYEFVKTRIINCYQVLVPLAIRENDQRLFLQYAKDYLVLGTASMENIEQLVQVFTAYIPMLLMSEKSDEAKEMSNLFVRYTKELEQPNKYYVEALKYRVVVSKAIGDNQVLIQTVPVFAKETELVYTKKSPEFVDAKKELANLYLQSNNVNM